MSFNERSSWVMLVALLVCGGLYLANVFSLSSAAGELIQPSAPMLISFTVLLVAVSIVGHILLAALSPKEAQAPLDEREQMIFRRAGNASGAVLAIGVVTSLVHYLAYNDGDLLFYMAFASLVLSSIAEYLLKVILYRRAF